MTKVNARCELYLYVDSSDGFVFRDAILLVTGLKRAEAPKGQEEHTPPEVVENEIVSEL